MKNGELPINYDDGSLLVIFYPFNDQLFSFKQQVALNISIQQGFSNYFSKLEFITTTISFLKHR